MSQIENPGDSQLIANLIRVFAYAGQAPVAMKTAKRGQVFTGKSEKNAFCP